MLIISAWYCLLWGQVADTGAKSESECLMSVKEADRFFKDGHYDKCTEVLEGVSKKCSLPRSEKMFAMELLAKAYIETDELGKAETAVNLMLKNFPHYELKEQENPESFNRLVRKYKVHPRFSLGIRNTADWIKFKTTKTFSVLEDVDYTGSYNQQREGIFSSFGLMYYGWVEFEFDKDISFNGDLIFKWTKFSRDFNKPSAFDLNYSETDNYIEVPLYVKKYFHLSKNLLPYVTTGMGWMYMTKATGNATINYTSIDSTATTGNINILGLRNRHTFEWIAGAGIGYKIKNLRLFLDARFYVGINSFTNPEEGFNNNVLIHDFFYIDNSVKLNQFELGASVSYTFINSVKRTTH